MSIRRRYLKTIRRRKKFLVAAMGPGEIAQGMAFSKHAIRRGASVVFVLLRKDNLAFASYQSKYFEHDVAEISSELKKVIKAHKPDLLVLCNSKIFGWDGKFSNSPPSPKPPTISIDSNWLFFPESPWPPLPWLDRYCINIPSKVFDLGLTKNGGHYTIDPFYEKRIRVVGLLPSYKKIASEKKQRIRRKFGVRKGEKFILLYTSVGGLLKPVVFDRAISAVKQLISKGRRIKMLYMGDAPSRGLKTQEDWLIILSRKSTNVFYENLASCDLVFQHQGLGTLEQSIAAEVPVIANVAEEKDDEGYPHSTHAWEVGPFARYGACSMLRFSKPVDIVAKEIEKLLYNQKARLIMKKRQRSLHSKGEEAVYRTALELLKESKRT